MHVIHSAAELGPYLKGLGQRLNRHPVLVDKFLEDALEMDVDAVSDGRDIRVVIMEQVERAGVHSGDSTCVYPPHTLSDEFQDLLRTYTLRLARYLGVVGLLNVQYAIKDGVAYLLEANARASRTVPFASKASGMPLTCIATRLILGTPLSELEVNADLFDAVVNTNTRGQRQGWGQARVCVKTVVFPFDKFPSLSRVLGPEMQSTGEAMGIGEDFASALAKAQDGVVREATLLY